MSTDSLEFAQPLWLAAGAVVCAAMVALFIRFDRRREADLAKLVHPRFRQRLTEGFSQRRRNLKRGLWLLAMMLVFTAVARPQKGYEWREAKRKGIDILFAVDTSRSMLAEDLAPNRLERARLGIIDFVARLDGDRVGLIPFAGSAFALCPLTLDYDAFRESLAALDTDIIPRQGTDIASAIKEAGRLFDETGNNHRVLVLLTDGEDLQGDVIDAAKSAADKGMAIYTVGVGSPAGARIPIRYQNGRTDFVRNEDGSIVETKLDETTLKKIAEETDALYVALGRGAEGLDTIYQEKLRLVPKSEQDQRMERIPLERFEWPLGIAIFLLLLEFFISDRRRVHKSVLQTQAAAAITLVFLALGVSQGKGADTVSSPQDPRKNYNLGTEAYVKGDFGKAAESLRSSLRTPDLALQQRSYYNLGNTLYRTGQGTIEKDSEATVKTWEEAIKAYQDALALNAADEDAKFNKALVEKKLEELKQQKKDDPKDDKKQEDDKKEQDKEQQDKKEQDKQQKDSKEKEDSQKGKDPKGGDDSKDGKKPDKDVTSKDGEKESKEGKDSKEGEKPEGDQTTKEKGESKPGEEEPSKESAEGKDGPEKPGEEPKGEMSNERVQKQEMTPEEAKQLLEALRQDQRTVIPIPRERRTRFATPDNSTKGKTW